MSLFDLEEAQGMTGKQLRAGLEKEGWSFSGDKWERVIDGVTIRISKIDELLLYMDNRQAFLRATNPRFRVGIPSEAARTAHPGRWLAKTASGGLVVGTWKHDLIFGLMLDCFGATLQAKTEWSYWPVDEEGARVPWPEKDRVML